MIRRVKDDKENVDNASLVRFNETSFKRSFAL
jgi:hypothetical protein